MVYSLRGNLDEAKKALNYLEAYLKDVHGSWQAEMPFDSHEAHISHFLNEARGHVQAALDILDGDIAKAVARLMGEDC